MIAPTALSVKNFCAPRKEKLTLPYPLPLCVTCAHRSPEKRRGLPAGNGTLLDTDLFLRESGGRDKGNPERF